MKTKAYIEIVCTNTPDLSSMSERSRLGLARSLRKKFTSVRISVVNNEIELRQLINRRPDLVLLGAKYIYAGGLSGNQIWLSEVLDESGISYCGSQKTAQLVERCKDLAKNKVASRGVATSLFYVLKQNSPDYAALTKLNLGFPLFIKPVSSGGGSGINELSIANTLEDLKLQFRLISNKYKTDCIVEKFLSGREFSVAILRNLEDSTYKVMPIELIAPRTSLGDRILGQRVKQADAETVKAVAPGPVRNSLKILAIDAFMALGGRDYGRIDIRMDAAGKPHFLEANLIPSLIENYGSFPKACLMNENISFDNMTATIIKLGLQRRRTAEHIEPITASKRLLGLELVVA